VSDTPVVTPWSDASISQASIEFGTDRVVILRAARCWYRVEFSPHAKFDANAYHRWWGGPGGDRAAGDIPLVAIKVEAILYLESLMRSKYEDAKQFRSLLSQSSRMRELARPTLLEAERIVQLHEAMPRLRQELLPAEYKAPEGANPEEHRAFLEYAVRHGFGVYPRA
jgi:hypothetical protein